MTTYTKLRRISVEALIARVTATGLLVNGLRIISGVIKPVAGKTAVIDLTDVATGEADVVLKDNLADALTFREAATAYLTFVTTNAGEKITAFKSFVFDAGLLTDTIAEKTSAAGVTVDGLRIKGAAITPAAGGAAVIDLTNCATGEGDIVLADNLAVALEVREAANSYLKYKTTNDKEAVVIGKILHQPSQAPIDMADATHKLVLGTAGAGETKLVCNGIAVDANSAGTEELWLPPVADFVGELKVFNVGGESIVLKDSNGANTLINGGGGLTIATGKFAILGSTGAAWAGMST